MAEFETEFFITYALKKEFITEISNHQYRFSHDRIQQVAYDALSKEEKDLLQSLIDSSYEQFVKAVAEGRKLSEEKH